MCQKSKHVTLTDVKLRITEFMALSEVYVYVLRTIATSCRLLTNKAGFDAQTSFSKIIFCGLSLKKQCLRSYSS